MPVIKTPLSVGSTKITPRAGTAGASRAIVDSERGTGRCRAYVAVAFPGTIATLVRVRRPSSLRRLAQKAAVITVRNVSIATGARGAIEI
jgi:hypothetical protein